MWRRTLLCHSRPSLRYVDGEVHHDVKREVLLVYRMIPLAGREVQLVDREVQLAYREVSLVDRVVSAC